MISEQNVCAGLPHSYLPKQQKEQFALYNHPRDLYIWLQHKTKEKLDRVTELMLK